MMRDDGAPKKRTVLIVEDDELFSKVMTDKLTAAGLVCEQAATGAEAIARAAEISDVLLLLDEQLPDMPGHAVVSALSSQGLQVPFIVVTGKGDERLAVDMMKAGAADYLVKDTLLLDRLATVVQRVIQELDSARMLRRAEVALLESERRFRGLFNEIESVAIQGCNEDGGVIYWNRAATHLYGYSESEALNKDIWTLLLPLDMQAGMRDAIRKMTESGIPMPTTEMRLLRKTGETVVVLMSYAIVRSPDGRVEWFMMGVDLTDRKAIEAERERLRSQLSKAQKLEAIGRLADGVTHDLNNMIGVISGYVELGMSQASGNEDVRELFEEIGTAAMRSADISRQLMSFTRKQEGFPRIVDLNLIIKNMLKMLQRLVGAAVEVVFEPDSGDGAVYADPSHLEQILANLCVNAGDAIHDTGKITIRTTLTTMTAQMLQREHEAKPGEYVVLSVIDTGCGMSDDVKLNLFEPFYTTKPSGEGWGLGLAAIYGLVRQNAGFISVDSVLGEGTAFHIYLPHIHQSADRCIHIDDDDMAPHSEAPKSRQTVMIVDDETAVVELGRMALEREGYTVLAAPGPNEAIAMLERHGGALDLLITDVIMPAMNGRALADIARTRYRKIRCLYMSAYSPDMVADIGVTNDDAAFLQKPFTLHELIVSVDAVLSGDQSAKP